jgi:hypothetical protein
MTTQKIIGLICLVIGIVLLVRGHDEAGSFGSQANQFIHGTPSDRSMYFYIGGIVLTIFGASQLVWPGKK